MTLLNQIPIIVIVGPTAVGKTELSVELAKKYNGEIINGDSLQIYRQLDIGTGKIMPQEMEGIEHHLIDILDPADSYDVSQFVTQATQAIEMIYNTGKLPIIVGGTGLYIESLVYELELGEKNSSDPAVRERLNQQLENLGAEKLWKVLLDKDPLAAQKIPFQNSRRVIRALEVIEVTGNLFSDQQGHEAQISRFNEKIIVLDRNRQELYSRIDHRVLEMVESGLEDEVKNLYCNANGEMWQSLKGIGYKEWFPYFDGEISKGEVIAAIQQNSRRYAKRQLTWFRNRFKEKEWITISDSEQWFKDIDEIVVEHINS